MTQDLSKTFQPKHLYDIPLVMGSDTYMHVVAYCILRKTWKREIALDNETSHLGFGSLGNGRRSLLLSSLILCRG